MGFVKDSGWVFVGETDDTGGHLYHFSRALHRLFVAYVDPAGFGVCKQSMDNGKTWQIVMVWPNTIHATIRGQYVGLNIGNERVIVYDLDEGWDTFNKTYSTVNREVIPLPEIGGFVSAVGPLSNDSSRRLRFIYWPSGNLGSFFPGGIYQKIHAIWGAEGTYQKPEGSIQFVWHYTNPFFILNNYPQYATAALNFTSVATQPGSLRGRAEETDWEGFVSGKGTRTGVVAPKNWQGTISTVQGVWQSGGNAAPSYSMDVRDPSSSFPVNSVSSGVFWDDISQKRGTRGFVHGYDTVGLIEPGGVFAYTWREPSSPSIPLFKHRKSLGVIDSGFIADRIWMPYENGAFGMGFHGTGTVEGKSYKGLWWVWDDRPMQLDRRAILYDGKYVPIASTSYSATTERKSTHWW